MRHYFERGCLLSYANEEVFAKNNVGNVVNEFMMWACAGVGVSSNRRCYEVLETYGDTVLKLAATLLAYKVLRDTTQRLEKEKSRTPSKFL